MARGVPRLMVEDAAVATAGAALEGQAASIILLNRWVRAAASLLGCDSACIILSDAKIARVIARHNIPHAFLASERTLDKAPTAARKSLSCRIAVTGRISTRWWT